MDDNNNNNNYYYQPRSSSNYAISGKIMLSAIIVLFTVVIAMVFLHLYARWYLLRARRRLALRRLNNQSRSTPHLVFYVDPNLNNNLNNNNSSSSGLDPSVLKSLPVFVYGDDIESSSSSIECAVCLSEFEDHETVRCLPKCKHWFHIECIDMWFHSHSTCPLCRSPVLQITADDTSSLDHLDHVTVDETTIVVNVAGSTSSGEYCSDCRTHDDDGGGGGSNKVVPSSSSSSSSSSLFGMRRKPPSSIQVPRRTDADFGEEDPSQSSSYKSPAARIRSFRRILSRGVSSPSGGGGTSCEFDIEQRGRDELTPKTRADTPRS